MANKTHRIKVTANLDTPDLTAHTLDLIRLNARACGLEDVTYARTTLEVEVAGFDSHHPRLDEFKVRLRNTWLDLQFEDVKGEW